jgi:hypothetical protein
VLAVALGLLVLACGGDPRGVVRRPIVGGTDDAGDAAVVALVSSGGATWCTGTLVAPRVVLTAAHCGIDARTVFDYRAVFGGDVAAAAGEVALVDAHLHPDYDDATGRNDFALLHLAEEAPAAPVPLFAGPVDDALVGQGLRLVGFGVTAADANDAGRKRAGTATVTSYDAASVTVAPAPALPCMHDSGGPAFVTVGTSEHLAGVTWSGDASCVDHGVYGRVDAILESFVAPYLARSGRGAAHVGERCFYPEHCDTGLCLSAVDEPRITYCTQPCARDAECPADLRCLELDGLRQCRYPTPTPGAPGAGCAAPDECLDECVVSLGICGRRCVPLGAGACPAGFRCELVGAGVDFYCLPEPHAGSCSAAGVTRGRGAGTAGWLAVYVLAARVARRRRA